MRLMRAKSDLIGIGGNALPWEPNFDAAPGPHGRVARQLGAGRAGLGYIHPSRTEWNWGLLDDQINAYRARAFRSWG